MKPVMRYQNQLLFRKSYKPARVLIVSTVSMKTCTNISTRSWPTTKVAKATRHSRYNPGCAFSLGLSTATIGQQPEGNLDRLGVSR